MQLGINSVHGLEEWSRFRPTVDQGRQIEPPWWGNWGNRTYVDRLVPGVEYFCTVSDHGSVQGDYKVSAQFPLHADLRWTLRGSVEQHDGFVRFGIDNAWFQFTVQQEISVADLSFSLIAKGELVDRQFYKNAFTEALKPFHACYRAMTLCGVESRVYMTRTAEQFGGFARAPLRWDDRSQWGIFDDEAGCNPILWFPPGIRRAWINVPPVIAASPAERAKWVYEAHRHSSHVPEVFISPGNEMWDPSKAVGQLLLQFGAVINHRDPNVGRCIAYLLLCRDLKQTIEAMGLQHKFKVVIEWQIGNRWPFIYDTHRKQYVSEQCRELAWQIGRFAIAPYAGRSITDLDQLPLSVDEEMLEVDAWVGLLTTDMHLDINNIHCYEASPLHFHPAAPLWWNRSEEALAAVPQFYEGLRARLGRESVVCHYGLCENDKWGALLKLEDWQDDPLYKAIAAQA